MPLLTNNCFWDKWTFSLSLFLPLNWFLLFTFSSLCIIGLALLCITLSYFGYFGYFGYFFFTAPIILFFGAFTLFLISFLFFIYILLFYTFTFFSRCSCVFALPFLGLFLRLCFCLFLLLTWLFLRFRVFLCFSLRLRLGLSFSLGSGLCLFFCFGLSFCFLGCGNGCSSCCYLLLCFYLCN